MSGGLKKRVLETDAKALREKSVELDQSLNFEEEDARHNHELKRTVKDELRRHIPKLVSGFLVVLCMVTLGLLVLGGRYLFNAWENPDSVQAIVHGSLTHVGSFVFGTLVSVVFKIKHKN